MVSIKKYRTPAQKGIFRPFPNGRLLHSCRQVAEFLVLEISFKLEFNFFLTFRMSKFGKKDFWCLFI